MADTIVETTEPVPAAESQPSPETDESLISTETFRKQITELVTEKLAITQTEDVSKPNFKESFFETTDFRFIAFSRQMPEGVTRLTYYETKKNNKPNDLLLVLSSTSGTIVHVNCTEGVPHPSLTMKNDEQIIDKNDMSVSQTSFLSRSIKDL